MAAELEDEFVKDQKVWVKRAMKGRPLYFGLQAKAAKSGKFLLSKRPGDVKPNAVKEMAPYEGKDADKMNVLPGAPSMGVATGDGGVLTLHFQRGKALPVAEKFVKYFVSRLLKCKMVKKVVIAEDDQLPAVPESTDADTMQTTRESIQERADALSQRSGRRSGDSSRLEGMIRSALEVASTNIAASDDVLDEVEFLLDAYERLASLERALAEVETQPGVAAEIVAGIRTKRLLQVRQQLDSGQADEADDNLDVAEQSIANLRSAVRPSPGTDSEPSSVESDIASQWAEKRKQITPDLTRCLKEQLGDTEKMRAVFNWAQEKAEAGDYQKAITAIDNLSVLLTAAIRAGIEKPPEQTLSHETAIPTKDELTKRLLAIRDGVALAGAAEEFKGDIRAAAQAIQAADPGVVALLDELEMRLSVVAQQKRVAEAEKTIKSSAISTKAGVVEFAKLRLKLKAAQSSRATAAGNLQAACLATLSSPDFIDDPRARDPDTLDAVAKIGERVPPITEVAADVDDALDRMAKTTDPGERQNARNAALKSLSDYRSRLDAEPLLKDMQSTDAGNFVIYDGIAAAVDDLTNAISA